MLSLQDFLALCEEMGSWLARSPAGEMRLKEIIRDDMRAAARSDPARARALERVLREFILKHPCCESRHQPRT